MALALLLTDDHDSKALIGESLRLHKAISASSITEALRFLRLSPVQIFFIDLYITNENGMSFVRKIVREFPRLKTVVFYSGKLAETTMLRAAELLGAHMTLSRPLTVPKVRAAIQKVLNDLDSDDKSYREENF